MVKIKSADIATLTKLIDTAVRTALASFVEENQEIKVISKTKYVNLNHTDLLPEGHSFTIQMAVDMHERTVKE